MQKVEGITFLLLEILFCGAFVAACEFSNFTGGKYEVNACVERWMFAGGVFFPSSVQSGVGAYNQIASRVRSRKDPNKPE